MSYHNDLTSNFADVWLFPKCVGCYKLCDWSPFQVCYWILLYVDTVLPKYSLMSLRATSVTVRALVDIVHHCFFVG